MVKRIDNAFFARGAGWGRGFEFFLPREDFRRGPEIIRNNPFGGYYDCSRFPWCKFFLGTTVAAIFGLGIYAATRKDGEVTHKEKIVSENKA